MTWFATWHGEVFHIPDSYIVEYCRRYGLAFAEWWFVEEWSLSPSDVMPDARVPEGRVLFIGELADQSDDRFIVRNYSGPFRGCEHPGVWRPDINFLCADNPQSYETIVLVEGR